METKRILSGVFSTCCIVAVTAICSCHPMREGERADTDTKTENRTTEETVEVLDERIGELNQELTLIERELIKSEKATEEDVRESWMDIEAKRQVLNQTIDTYNTAVQEGAEEEAERLKTEIYKQLDDIEEEVEDFTDEVDIDTNTINPE